MEIAGNGDEPSYVDLGRPPLSARALRAAVIQVPPWRELHLLAETPSTNDVVAVAARAGESEGIVVVAESQSSGRGRLGREWVSPPRAGLMLSVLLRPDVAPERWSWLPLLAGAATARALGERTGLEVRLKWPNDLLVEGRKVGGLLAEVVDGAVVVGIGINVSTTRAELPRADATSLASELPAGEVADRAPLLLAVLRALGPDYLEWVADGGRPDALRGRYVGACATLGRDVTVTLPNGEVTRGSAVDVDEHGRLVVRDESGAVTAHSAGDVVHAALAD